MSDLTLTKTLMRNGVWEGIITSATSTETRPDIAVMYLDQPLEQTELSDGPDKGQWTLKVSIPAHAIADGVQTFVILDRTKDMIVANGFNVYPKEVESIIAELEQVQSVAVVGVPDDIQGERIHGFVVLKPGATLSEAQVFERCVIGLSSYKRPKKVHFIKEMPLTGSGKIRRVQLRDMLASNKDETT